MNLEIYQKLCSESKVLYISNYPSACSLIAKSLLDKDVFNLIAE